MAVVAPPRHGEVWLVTLDPALGSEIQKTRPCVIVSPDDMNQYLRTVIVAPMTTAERSYPSRVRLEFQRKRGQVALDQIRATDQQRLVKKLGTVSLQTAETVRKVLREMFS